MLSAAVDVVQCVRAEFKEYLNSMFSSNELAAGTSSGAVKCAGTASGVLTGLGLSLMAANGSEPCSGEPGIAGLPSEPFAVVSVARRPSPGVATKELSSAGPCPQSETHTAELRLMVRRKEYPIELTAQHIAEQNEKAIAAAEASAWESDREKQHQLVEVDVAVYGGGG